EPLRYIDRDAAVERSLALGREAKARVEADIGGKASVGIDPQACQLGFAGEPLGESQQLRAQPLALRGGIDRDVDDEQEIAVGVGLDETDEPAVALDEVETAARQRRSVIDLHRQRLA